MKTTEIITLNPITATSLTFKDERLAKATQRITAIYADAAKYADTKNREIAKVLGDVATKKAYEIDGFKSVADYASTVFGIARQNAYALANAGKVYNDKDAHPELQAMSPSKIAELAPLSTKAINAALNSGKINRDTTQKDLREFADKARPKDDKEGEEPVVLDTFTARPCLSTVTDEMADTFSMGKTMEDWDEWFMGYVSNVSPDSPVEIVKLPKGKVDPNRTKATINRRLYFNRAFSIVVEFYTYVAPKPAAAKNNTPKFTKEQLLAMLAEMEGGEKQK